MPPTTLYPRLQIARHFEFESKTSLAMYSRGITGSCLRNSVLRFVRITWDRGWPSFSAGIIWMVPFRSSMADGFSDFIPGYYGRHVTSKKCQTCRDKVTGAPN